MPKWFKGMIYTKGAEVTNPFSGNSYELNAEELSVYDFILGAQMVCESIYGGMLDQKTAYIQKDMAKALQWFRTNNPEAYYVLLD
tara:strand:- start:22 stop:276 length:255 start_codon:yes stop_codon:yes gene_type:complete